MSISIKLRKGGKGSTENEGSRVGGGKSGRHGAGSRKKKQKTHIQRVSAWKHPGGEGDICKPMEVVHRTGLGPGHDRRTWLW